MSTNDCGKKGYDYGERSLILQTIQPLRAIRREGYVPGESGTFSIDVKINGLSELLAKGGQGDVDGRQNQGE